MERRTERDFAAPGAVWPAVERWAQADHYVLRDARPDSTRLYEKPHALRRALGRWTVEVAQRGETVHLAAWIRFRFVHRLGTLFLVPRTVPVESGFRMYWLRRKARRDVNELLEALGQPPIR